MTRQATEVKAARELAAQAAEVLKQAPAYRELDQATRAALTSDLSRIQSALSADPHEHGRRDDDPYALSLAGPADLLRRRMEATRPGRQPPSDIITGGNGASAGPRSAATETLVGRTGALIDEIDFPGFVASLIQGTFDALVDASIRQMEAYASLVSAVASDVDRFTSENVTTNQVRDWLVEQHPGDVELHFDNGHPRLQARTGSDDEPRTPVWLEDYGLEGEELTNKLLEEQLIPVARQRIGEQRLQMLATMVLMGMNRILIQDGSITTKVRFRAAARDRARVDYAQSVDPGGTGATWGSRGTYNQASMMVSTVGANVQADTELRAELFGEVRINFASETVPLDRFADAAQIVLLQRNARQGPQQSPAQAPPPEQPPARTTPDQGPTAVEPPEGP